MEKKSERHFKEYLKKIPNEQLIQFYDDVEWTAFPILVIKEYQNRFKSQNKKEMVEKLKTQAELAKGRAKDLQTFAIKRGSKISRNLKIKGKKLTRSISKTKLISSEKNLTILEKLGELNKKGIITNKEFLEKKKKLLKRI